jgi:hypothetical protein
MMSSRVRLVCSTPKTNCARGYSESIRLICKGKPVELPLCWSRLQVHLKNPHVVHQDKASAQPSCRLPSRSVSLAPLPCTLVVVRGKAKRGYVLTDVAQLCSLAEQHQRY